RPADWQTPLVGKPPELVAAAAAVTGFRGVLLNLSLYPDGASVTRSAQRVLGGPQLVLPGRFAFFDLGPFASRLGAARSHAALAALRESVLHPVRLAFGADWGPQVSAPDVPASIQRSRWTHKRRAVLTLENPAGRPRRARLAAVVFTATDRPAGTVITWPDGVIQRVKVSADGTPITHTVTLRPGSTIVTVTTTAPTTPDPTSKNPAYLELANYTLTDSVQQSFEAPVTRAG
ncbi:MAG: hypothetical protein ACJ77Z_13885, partial [Thermoleophilaceae bacterium]